MAMLENDIYYQRNILADVELKLRPARITLRVVAIVHFLIGLIFLFFSLRLTADIITVIVFTFIGGLFLTLSFTMNSYPKVSSITGLLLYTFIITFYFFTSIVTGIYLIVALIICIPLGFWYLIRAIRSAKEVNEQRMIVQKLEGRNMPMDLMQ